MLDSAERYDPCYDPATPCIASESPGHTAYFGRCYDATIFPHIFAIDALAARCCTSLVTFRRNNRSTVASGLLHLLNTYLTWSFTDQLSATIVATIPLRSGLDRSGLRLSSRTSALMLCPCPARRAGMETSGPPGPAVGPQGPVEQLRRSRQAPAIASVIFCWHREASQVLVAHVGSMTLGPSKPALVDAVAWIESDRPEQHPVSCQPQRDCSLDGKR